MSDNSSAIDRPFLDFGEGGLTSTTRLRIADGLPAVPRSPNCASQAAAESALLVICDSYEIDLDILRFGGKAKAIAEARMVGYWLLRTELHLSYPEVGRVLGGKDHTCVIHGVRRCVERREADAAFRGFTDALVGAVVARMGVKA